MRNSVLEEYRWLNECCIAKGEELVRCMVLGDMEKGEVLQRTVADELKGLNGEREKIVEAIDKVEDIQLHLILTLRYLLGLDWKEIQRRMGYSKNRIKRMHMRALRKFEKLYRG